MIALQGGGGGGAPCPANFSAEGRGRGCPMGIFEFRTASAVGNTAQQERRAYHFTNGNWSSCVHMNWLSSFSQHRSGYQLRLQCGFANHAKENTLRKWSTSTFGRLRYGSGCESAPDCSTIHVSEVSHSYSRYLAPACTSASHARNWEWGLGQGRKIGGSRTRCERRWRGPLEREEKGSLRCGLAALCMILHVNVQVQGVFALKLRLRGSSGERSYSRLIV